MTAHLLAPASFRGLHPATWDLLRTLEHAALWRLMWRLPAWVLVLVAVLGFLVLRFYGRRRRWFR